MPIIGISSIDFFLQLIDNDGKWFDVHVLAATLSARNTTNGYIAL